MLLQSFGLKPIPMMKKQPMASAETGTTPPVIMEIMPVDSSIRNLQIADIKTDAETFLLVVFSTDSSSPRVFSTEKRISPLRRTAIRTEAEETANKKRKKEDKK